MDEEQKRKFEEWWNDNEPFVSKPLKDSPRAWAKIGWDACALSNKVKEQEPETSLTEMFKQLLEKGWFFTEGEFVLEGGQSMMFDSLEHSGYLGSFNIRDAYRKAFPPKKKIEVEVWIQQCPDNKHKVRETGYFGIAGHDLWTKGIATFR